MRLLASQPNAFLHKDWPLCALIHCLIFILIEAKLDCLTDIRLAKVGDSQRIESALTSGTTRRWNVYGNGRPIQVKVTQLRMAAPVPVRGMNTIKLCLNTRRLKIVDNKCK